MFRLPFILFSCLLFVSCQKETRVDKATREGILLLGNSADPKSLDPHVATGVLESNIMRAVFEGLINSDPKVDLGAPTGAALSVIPDDTYTIWTVKLRPDAKWSDGHPVTSEDFRFAYERMLLPDFAAQYAGMLYFLKGAEAFNKSKTKDFSTVGMTVTDPLSFTLTLRGSTPYFREILKHFTWYPIPKHIVLKHGSVSKQANRWSMPANLVGNGPFRITSFRRNDHIEVERNPHYWDSKNITLNGIRFLPVSNVFTEARMFRDGQMHITSTAAPESVDLMKKIDPRSLRQEPYLGTDFYRFNTKRKPLDDVRVRRAISMAIDRKALCKNVFRGATPAHGMTPPMGDYVPPQGAGYDPEKARVLLAEAGFPGGKGFPRLKVLIATKETNLTLATAAQAMWSQNLGIELEIENKEWTAYLAATQEMDYDIVSSGWLGDFIDPLTFLEMWTPGNDHNNTGWASTAYAETLEKSFHSTDPAERYGLLKEAETILLEDAPIAPIVWRGKNFLIHPSVEGWYPLLLDNHPFNSVRLVPQGIKR
jgi:oligopeptide transport system substrate-binding protein